jgi:multidrug efflux pump subunit AcrA (membrane-fusion protein)
MRHRQAALGSAVLVLLVAGFGYLSADLRAPGVETLVVTRGRFVREVSAEGTLEAVRATPISSPTQARGSRTIAWLARDGARVRAGDVVVRFDARPAEKEAADGRDDLEAAREKTRKAQAEGSRKQRGALLDQELAADALDRARTFTLSDPEFYAAQTIAESRADRELHEKKAVIAEQRLEVEGELTAADVALGRIEAEQAALRLRQAEQSLGALSVQAPHDGLFVLERDWSGNTRQVGESVWPGQKLAQIPDLAELEARVWALEADAAGLQPELPARVVVEGRAGRSYQARVARVQPVAAPRDRRSPVKYFEAALAIVQGDPELLRPGQRVQATIVLEEREDVIALPRSALFERDERQVVYRESGGRFVPVEVEVGPNSVSRVVILVGLEPGDRVALRDPYSETPATADALAGGPAAPR